MLALLMRLQGGMASGGGGSERAAYLCFLLLGSGTLFPWNALITAADYWNARFPGKHTERLMTVSYLPVNLIVIAGMVHWHARVRPHLRVLSGLAGFTLAMSAVPLLDLLPASDAALAAVLLLVAACGAFDGLAQGALFGEAALLPPRYTQALVSGTAVSGVVTSLLRCLTKATLPDTEAGLRRSANLYFVIAALVCAACTAIYGWVLPRQPAMQRYRQAALDAALHGGGSGEDGADGGEAAPAWKLLEQQEQAHGRGSLDVELTHGGGPDWQATLEQQLQQPDRLGEDGRQEAADEELLNGGQGEPPSSSDAWLHDRGRMRSGSGAGSAQPLAAGEGGGGSAGAAIAVLRCIWRLALSNVLIYTVTLSVFPGVLAEDVSSAELGSWYPVALIAAFNLADWAGKSAPGWPSLRLREERVILAAVCARALFLPAFHFAAVGGAGPAIIGALALLLGSSNGYLTSCCMIEGAAAAPAEHAELAGNVMVLALIAGLCVGAACGFLWLL